MRAVRRLSGIARSLNDQKLSHAPENGNFCTRRGLAGRPESQFWDNSGTILACWGGGGVGGKTQFPHNTVTTLISTGAGIIPGVPLHTVSVAPSCGVHAGGCPLRPTPRTETASTIPPSETSSNVDSTSTATVTKCPIQWRRAWGPLKRAYYYWHDVTKETTWALDPGTPYVEYF